MIRLLHLSDSHWDHRGRLQDIRDIHDAILGVARRERVDAIVHAGDFLERRSVPEERTAIADWLRAASEICPVVGVKGNHDQEGDLAIFNRLRTRHPVRIIERSTAAPGSAVVVQLAGDRRVGVVGMAWVDKAHLAAGLDATVDQQETTALTISAVRDLLTCLRMEVSRLRSDGIVPVFVGHVMLGGSVVSSGQVLIGQGVELSTSDLLELGAAYAACGHIHVHQAWHGGRVAYSGSPHRCNLGEAREPKGVCVVTLDDDGTFIENRFVELPARRIVLIEEDWTVGDTRLRPALSAFDPAEIPGALVRLRYRIRPEDLHVVDEERYTAELVRLGAEEVTCEAVVEHQARVRSEEIVRAQTTFEKVATWARAKSIPIEDAQGERLRARVGELEALR